MPEQDRKIEQQIKEALVGLTRHDLLVQLVRQREPQLMTTCEDWFEGGLTSYRVLDAEAVAYLIEEVVALADH